MRFIKFIEANKRGQLEINNVKPLGKYYLITGKDFILIKNLEKPSAADQFDELTGDIQRQFKKLNINRHDIARAVKWARKK
jgi:hypothetical protein